MADALMAARLRRLLPALCLSLLLARPAWAEQWAAMPWGLATVWWDLPGEMAVFHSLSMGVLIDGDLPADSHVYIAPLGSGWLNDAGFYGGLQVGAPIPGGDGSDRIALFSRWGERRVDAARAAPGGFAVSSGDEGDFISVRHPLAWGRGHYTLRLAVTGQTVQPPQSWVEMTLREDASGRQWTIGSLRFPDSRLRLRPSLAAFVEIFGPAIAPEKIPRVTVVFDDLRINGVPVSPHHAEVDYRAGIPPYAEAEKRPSGSVAIRIGQVRSRLDLLPGPAGGWRQPLDW